MPDRLSIRAHQLTPPLNVTRIESLEQLTPLLDFFARCNGVLGWDIETTPLRDYYYRRCRTIQFGNAAEQYVIDLLPFCDNDPNRLSNAQGEYGNNLHKATKLKELLEHLRPVISTKDYLKVGVSLGFEYMTMYFNFGIRSFNYFDCALVEKCIYAGAHSLKDYGFFSMESMMDRYFGVLIDKELQTSFNLTDPLSDDQIAYAALDTRFPIGIKAAQTLILQGQTVKSLQAKGNMAWKTLANIDPLVTGDNLLEIAKIENDAIGAFEDMHIHGERIDREKWLARTAVKKEELKTLISDVLDPIFLPIVGSKLDVIREEDIVLARDKWKSYDQIPDHELQVKSQIRTAKKSDPTSVPALEAALAKMVEARKAEKEKWKQIASELGKKRTRIKNLAAMCEGEALINYSSDTQLLAVLKTMKGLKNINSLDDELLEKYKHISVMAAIQKYHGLSKQIGTYGDQWATEWLTKPCKEEGWLHPGDGRLHSVFNQYNAETGRSSSEKPNGQNIEADKEVRSCFIADPPDESVRISTCKHQTVFDVPKGEHWSVSCYCGDCGSFVEVETKPEEQSLLTIDMAGAELRIIAELANDPVWIGAFERGEDVHSVGTELLYEEQWPKLALPDCAYYKLHDEESVKKNPKCIIGEPQRQKCKCPDHKELRDQTKSVNFLLAYGGGPFKLAASIGKSLDEAKQLMAIHAAKFPRIWEYLEKSGRRAKILKKAFDMFGRRRLFPEPTPARALEKAKDDRGDELKFSDEESLRNVDAFITNNNRKPTPDERWSLTHRQPTEREVTKALIALSSGIERQGKNHPVQSANATIAKISMGCGYDPEGKPFLWHVLPQYKARLIKFVHDELVISVPTRHAAKVAELVGDAFRRAAATRMKSVVMESDFAIAGYWKK